MVRKKTYQFDIDGNFIAEYDYAGDAAKALKIPQTYVSRSAYRGDLIEGKWFFSYHRDFKVTGERRQRADRIKLHKTKKQVQEIYISDTKRSRDCFLLDMF